MLLLNFYARFFHFECHDTTIMTDGVQADAKPADWDGRMAIVYFQCAGFRRCIYVKLYFLSVAPDS